MGVGILGLGPLSLALEPWSLGVGICELLHIQYLSMKKLLTSEWFWIAGLTGLVVLAASWPYWLAYTVPAPASRVFGGVLVNPVDGNSYFAKMREGWRGDWLFTLPYTTQPGPGVFIYTYYLFLGHLARWTGASIELVYHTARFFSGAFLLLTAYHFISRFFDSFRERLAVWLLFALGSGLGWVAALFGGFTSDLWVAEAIPFLSVLTSSHFCLSSALMLWIFEWTLPGLAKGEGSPSPLLLQMTLVGLATLALAQLQPLALLMIGLVLGTLMLWHFFADGLGAVSPRSRRYPLGHGLWPSLRRRFFPKGRFSVTDAAILPACIFGLSAVPWLIYDALVMGTQPMLAGWNAQNLTPSPPAWDALIAGGMPLLLAVLGGVVAARRRSPLDLIPLAWLSLNILALYAPFSLQRRLSLGIWTPIVLLAAVGFREVIAPRLAVRWQSLLMMLVILLSSLSNLLVYVATLGGIQKRDPAIFLTSDEVQAFDWLAKETPSGAIVLAAPKTGLFIPAHTDARVIYGHPFETVEAQAHKQAIEDFFTGHLSPESFFALYPVDYIFYGPREKQLGTLPELNGWHVVFQQSDVTIYGR